MSKIQNILIIFFLSIFSFSINFYFGNIGVFPIDTFAYFDTGYLILKGQIPIKDFWISTGFGVDILQSIFFKIFGINWNSYLIHSSFANMFACLFSYFFFLKFNLNKNLIFSYCILISALLYPLVGTPFAYQHAFIFSLLGLFVLCLAIKEDKKSSWFFLPVIFLMSFLFMQTPSIYIIILSIIIIFVNLLISKNYKNILLLVSGSFISLIFLFLILLNFNIQFYDFLNQYIFFPSSIGLSRIFNEDSAFIALSSNFNFKSVIGHFKFFHILLIFLVFCLIRCPDLKEKKKNQDFIIFIIIILSSYLFIFNQLITANQTFIFSLIPILGLFAHYGISRYFNKKNYLNFFVIIIVSISSIKYFNDYVLKRKFIDLQSVDLNYAINANNLSPKFRGLKWITPVYSKNPKKEINVINQSLTEIKADERIKMVITDYQFYSILLDENLHNLNRWYTHDNNSYPLNNNKYFDLYKNFINNKIKNNNIEVIYIIDSNAKNNININNFKTFLPEYCFDSVQIVEKVFSKHEINKC
ncbi:MAG: hypothetical protein CL687_01640 [Candidatus Pelagibacter sp.]|nr:hypothetical protein [Candidatus Pelagibacter sp.]OUW24312.1 MAG: hypothetical protein CBD34_00915 [Rickettsiales bacterium TMED174]|tara:strand:+ start:3006 stop:4589 length:1584 start_codon:yes stop_codon:yes gene_type:complete